MGWSMRNWWKARRAYSAAFGLARAGKAGEAVKAFDQVVNALPRHARAHAQRALALAAAGRSGEAVRAAHRAAKLDPQNHAPLLFLGQIHYDARNLEEARKAFLAASRLDPQNRLVQAYLGLTLLASGQIQEGAGLLTTHLRYANTDLEGRLVTLTEQYLWERRGEARPLEQQLTPDEGGPEEGRAGLGLKLASAVRTAVLYPLARMRGRAPAYALIGEEALSVRDFDAAITAFRKSEEAGADLEDTALALGQVYLEARNARAAAQEFARLREETRNDPRVALLVGAASFDAGRYEEAREPLAIAAARFTRDFAPCYFRGLCEIALGRQKAALPWFIQAAERLNPHLAEKRLEEMLRVTGLAAQPGQRKT
jgi:tetratricopeptide (TPR) repeat protein